MARNPYTALWQDWIAHPVGGLAASIYGAIRFTFFNLGQVPAFVRRHVIDPPRVHMFPERLYVLVSRFFSSSLWLLVPGAALGGRLLNGGLIFLPLQKLLFAYALRTQLVNLAVDHLLPGMIGLLLISRAGMGIAIRTTLSRARGTWPSLNTPDDAALIRAADLLVLPRALAVGLAGLLLACFGLMALMAGFAFQWDAVRFSTTVDTFLFGFKDFTSLTGIPALLWCLLKSAFIGTAVGFVSCYEGLRGPPHETDVYQVIARTFGSSAAAWLITDIWMTLLWSGLERFVSGGIA